MPLDLDVSSREQGFYIRSYVEMVSVVSRIVFLFPNGISTGNSTSTVPVRYGTVSINKKNYNKMNLLNK